MQVIERAEAKASFLSGARYLSACVASGFVSGLVIGGIGGRLAMFVLRLTSDPALQGVQTDDGFTVGRFSGETMFLVLAAAMFGALGGVIYAVSRRWFPGPWRVPAMGAFFGAIGAAFAIRPDGVDFTLLSPLWLAIAMFIALPVLYGVSMVLFAERLLDGDSVLSRGHGWIVGLVPLALATLLGGIGLLIGLVAVAIWAVAGSYPRAVKVWRSAPVTWAGRASMFAVVVGATAEVVRDCTKIL